MNKEMELLTNYEKNNIYTVANVLKRDSFRDKYRTLKVINVYLFVLFKQVRVQD